ncbi:MAG: archaeal proteasome endopeptidase complex subunit alpha [Candidatus Anstonellales archaeon]
MYGISPQAYDRAITVFSPDGRLFQVSYAKEAVKRGSIALGVVVDGGLVMGAHKTSPSPLAVPSSLHKVFVVDDHICIAASGLIADARRLVDYARNEANKHRMVYNEPISVYGLSKSLGDTMQAYTQYGGARPFGVSLLVGGLDGENKLYEIEPSGAITGYMADAIGSGKDEVMAMLEKEYKKEMSIDGAIRLVVAGIKKSVEQKIGSSDIEITVGKEDKKVFQFLSEEEIQKYL